MLRHLALDFLDGDLALRGAQNVRQALLRQVQRDLATDQRGKRKEPGQRTLQHPHVCRDAMREEFQHTFGHLEVRVLNAMALQLALQNSEAQFVVSGMKIDDQAALHARADALFHIRHLTGRAITGNDDLLVLIHQCVERVKKFFLCGVLAGDELDVVDHKHVNSAEQRFEIHCAAFANGLHKTVHELFGGKVNHPQLGFVYLQLVRDGMHQVGLAQPNAAIKKQRIKGHGPAFGHATGGGMGQFVRLADNEPIEGKTRIQRRRLKHRVKGAGPRRCRGIGG